MVLAAKTKLFIDYKESRATKTHCPEGVERQALLNFYRDHPRTKCPNITVEDFLTKPVRRSRNRDNQQPPSDDEDDFGDLEDELGLTAIRGSGRNSSAGSEHDGLNNNELFVPQ